MRNVLMVCSLLMSFLITGSVLAELSDPYEIYLKHYEATGGLDKQKAIRSTIVEGELDLVGTGLKGSFKQWNELPLRSRQEVDLTIIQQTTGDNGENAWSVDQNGKLQINRDEITLKQRKLQKLIAEFDHLNKNSEFIKLDFQGTDTVGDKNCYVIRMTNTINDDTTVSYFDKESYYLLKAASYTPSGQSISFNSDFRENGGLMVSYKQEMTMLPVNMTQITNITKMEFNTPIDPSIFEPPAEDVEDFVFTNGKSIENLKFEFIENHIYFPVTVGGLTRVWVLDSGAGATVVESSFARELGLELEGKMKGSGAGNVVDVSFTQLPPLQISGLELSSQKAATIELASLFQMWVGKDVAGILGYDFLSRVVTKVDYANELISFYHPDSFSYSGNGIIIDAPISKENMFHLPLVVDGEYGGKWNLDLGAGGMNFHYPFAKSKSILERKGITGLGHGAGGSIPEMKDRFKTIEFAGFKIDNPIVSWPLEKGEGAFSSGDLTGNLGNTILRHFILYLDYKNERVIVEKGDDFGKVFPEDHSGLQIANIPDQGVIVNWVSEGTPADKAGFLIDDLIVSIDGKNCEALGGIIGIKEMLRSDPGTTFKMIIKRGDEERELKLTLADLFN